jgi:hypothetical protein
MASPREGRYRYRASASQEVSMIAAAARRATETRRPWRPIAQSGSLAQSVPTVSIPFHRAGVCGATCRPRPSIEPCRRHRFWRALLRLPLPLICQPRMGPHVPAGRPTNRQASPRHGRRLATSGEPVIDAVHRRQHTSDLEREVRRTVSQCFAGAGGMLFLRGPARIGKCRSQGEPGTEWPDRKSATTTAPPMSG